MLMLTNLTQSDAGNYSCRSVHKSEILSQWIYINGKKILKQEYACLCIVNKLGRFNRIDSLLRLSFL